MNETLFPPLEKHISQHLHFVPASEFITSQKPLTQTFQPKNLSFVSDEISEE